jgi:hypothetical protein
MRQQFSRSRSTLEESNHYVRLPLVDSATEVRYGGVVVGRSPQVRDRSDAGAFVVFSEPLPVGTALLLKIDDQEKPQPARVTEVVESADASTAGMRVRFVTAAELRAPTPKPAAAAPAPVAAAAAPAPAAAPVATVASEPASAPVPVAVGGAGSADSAGSTNVPSSGDASAQHPVDSHAHHDGEHGRRKRRRK